MGFWEMLALVSVMATILGLFLTIYALINNKTLKEESRLTRELIDKNVAESQKILNRMEENMERNVAGSQKILNRMEEDMERMEGNARQMERNLLQGTQETKRILEKIAELIATEGQKTRQAIVELKGTA